MKLLKREFVFHDPAPTPACHASTVLQLSGGDMLAAWFGGTKEGGADVMIWVSRRAEGVWTKPVAVTAEQGIPHWNPVLFQPEEGTVYLFYKLGHTIPDWMTKYTVSYDGGVTWSEAQELIPGDATGGRGPVKNKPIRTAAGRILAPGSTERGRWKCFADLRDGKNGWKKAEIPSAETVNLIQPTLWEAPAGNIHALMRSDDGRLYRSDSEDGGEHWRVAYPTDIPNNNSGVDCAMTDGGVLVLVCNPVEKNWGVRSPLSVFTSRDNGETFQKELDLETEEGEFSYPAVITSGNRVYVTYTWKREKIAFCEIEV